MGKIVSVAIFLYSYKINYMEQVNIINGKGEIVNSFPLNTAVWQVPFSRENISRANIYYLANQRQGTKKTKSKGEVAGGGKKP
jgi:large subunit ribosomal protein L4